MKQAQNVEYRAPFESGARRSVSRVLSRPKAGMAIHLGRSLPNASCDRPERRRERPARRRRHHRHPPAAPTWSCSRWGFPCRRRCRRRGALLPHHFTLAARRPAERETGRGRRYVFCGTFPRVAPAGRYPAPCLRGARTFLPPPKELNPGGERPSDRLAWDHMGSHPRRIKQPPEANRLPCAAPAR